MQNSKEFDSTEYQTMFGLSKAQYRTPQQQQLDKRAELIAYAESNGIQASFSNTEHGLTANVTGNTKGLDYELKAGLTIFQGVNWSVWLLPNPPYKRRIGQFNSFQASIDYMVQQKQRLDAMS